MTAAAEAGGRGRVARLVDFDNLATIVILLVFTLFLIVPFATILIVSFTGKPVALLDALTGLEGARKLGSEIAANASLQFFGQLFSFPRYVRAFVNSMTLGFLVAVASVLVAMPIAYALARTRMPGRRLIGALCIVPLMVPTFISSFAFILMFGRTGWINQMFGWIGIEQLVDIHSPFGIGLVQVFFFFPYALLPMLAVFKSMDPVLEEASHTLGARRPFAFLTTTMPLAAPGIWAGLLLVLIVSIEDFGTPMILSPRGFPLMIVEAYREMVGYFNWGGASVIAVLLVLISALLLLVQRWLLRHDRSRTVGGKPATRERVRDPWVCWGLLAYCIIVLSLPILAIYTTALQSFATSWAARMVPEGFTLDNYRYVWERSMGAVVNSFLLGGAALAISVVLSAVIPYLVQRRGRHYLDYLGFLPLALPGTALAIALILAFNTPPLQITGTAFLLIMAYVIRRMPYALRSTSASIQTISTDIEGASLVHGASRFLSLWSVTLPLMLPGIVAGGIMVFLTSVREISATILLAPDGWKPMSLVIFEGLLRGEFYTSAAISMILILVVMAVQIAVFRLMGEKALF
ncbi:MAG: iron ABC transporter permease [Burkholderiales bacterium]|nr:iron ABC transporter permease [Burkholderiales bacterium]